MERLILVVVLAMAAVAVAFLLRRHQAASAPRPTRTGFAVPDHVDRADFEGPETPWLVAVFTSATCNTCAGVWDKAKLLASDTVVAQEVEVSARRELHDRYAIEAVPSTLLVDRDGVVRASFIGPVTATDLWATLAELRAPGTLPASGCDHGL